MKSTRHERIGKTIVAEYPGAHVYIDAKPVDMTYDEAIAKVRAETRENAGEGEV